MGCIVSVFSLIHCSLTKKKENEGKFKDRYHLGKELGKGNSSIVFEGKQQKTGHLYAIKVFKKSEMNPSEKVDLNKEIQVLQVMNHTNIIQFYGAFQDKEYFYLVLELMQGGNLLDRIIKRQSYTEVDARNTCKQIVEAIEYCHSKKIVHRDLKPDNALLMSAENDSQVKLGDFGFATIITKGENCLMTACGTPHFVAPEIIKAEPYGCAVDMWSLGVCTFLLLRGALPFDDDSDLRNLYRQICRKKIQFDEKYWKNISTEAKSFITSLLVVNPKERLTAKNALEHPWLSADHVGLDYHLSDNLEQLKQYNLKRKLRSAVYAVMATNKLTSLGYQRNTATDGLSD